MSRRVPFQAIFLTLILALSCAWPNLVSAQAVVEGGFDPKMIDQMTGAVHQVPLTEDMVDRLIASFPDMREESAKFPGTELPDQPPTSADSDSDLDAMPADKRAALEAVAVKHGFKGLQEWSDVAQSVVMSYVYAAQGKKPGALEEAVKMNIDSAERDPTLTAQQKKQTIAQYQAIGEKLSQLEPLKGNYELIVAMKDKVTPIMDPN